ncbi:LamG-like jellyroll fold domain-containing protein [Flavobacterium algicola]|uniref:LamG-like jellyroll fold domain-containing protein n=1 Tax=Flavobacterium algicola TaxID=556529 RepID=UPI001EFEB1B0|nr:LamG-like jellyroll fold domain-containing protein [Flavobacterium algicola]MCG9793075.1 T9SS type A sorting domain-containing protein [Flavobacterium algicola]
MEQNYFTIKKLTNLLVYIILLCIPTIELYAQLRVPFTQRTSSYSTSKKIYNIKGDFTMIGNTNMTTSGSSTTVDNTGSNMYFVDIDGDSSTLNSSSATLGFSTEGGIANPDCSKVIYAGLYWTGKSKINNNSPFTVTKGSVTNTYDKKIVKLKGGLASNYTTITASTAAIYYPKNSDDDIFVGYQEITDYVKTNGVGSYTVADIALVEGSNSPGYLGGWGIIVVYENPKMKDRAVTIFDGYAYVDLGNTGTIPIDGFFATLSGDVVMKLGVMASEGDRNRTGDALEILKLNKPIAPYNSYNYLTLSHAGNTANNFFNSSIYTDGNSRSPNYLNNTGMDISMFNVPNVGNPIIANGQTSTTFRYSSSNDKFSIFAFAMAVDAYIPKPIASVKVNTIAGVTPTLPLTALPGDEIQYKIDIKNNGSESTKNTIITIPIPASTLYTISSISTSAIHSTFSPANAPYFDSSLNAIIWNVGNIPLPSDPDTLLGSLLFKIKLTTDCATLFNLGCNNAISLNGTIAGNGSVTNVSFSDPVSQGIDYSTGCFNLIDNPIVVNFNSSSSTCFAVLAGPDKAPATCGLSSVTLEATTSTTGSWSVVSGPAGGGEVFSDVTNPNSEFSSPNSGVYTLRWTVPYGGGACSPIIDDTTVNIGLCNKLDFDGINDHVSFDNNYNLNSGSFSVETWIKPGQTNGAVQTIFSKRTASSLTDGYDLRIVNNMISFKWNTTGSITSLYPVSTGRWYHVAVTFNGTAYQLYIDGVAVQSPVSGTNPIANSSAKCVLGAMAPSTTSPYLPTNFFNGWMQEFRVWNIALTEDQMHQMMNQRILKSSTSVFGASVPLAIDGLSWNNLQAYFPMKQPTDLVNGNLVDKSANLRKGRLIGIESAQPENAPLPYTSSTDNSWENSTTWTYGSVWNIPNTLGVDGSTPIKWNIVQTSNAITTDGNKTVLGLLVESNTLSANTNNKIEISKYFKLDGKLDLVGKSQLVQTEGSILDVASAGFIERDQQGQGNKYNYNYWASPVSRINSTQNNSEHSVQDVLRDGTTTVPQNINWIGGYDGATTSPISVARYWLYKFDNYSNAYANWVQINETGTLRTGQGFTMKGNNGPSTSQNYTFVGKPNNGTISSNVVGASQLLLTGNPYPSALDSKAFINDNSTSFDGNIYFWEHYTTNNTHILRDYQGGYAVLNLTGGIPANASSTTLISGNGLSSKGAPYQYIPVGQAFFVYGKAGTGGPVIYKNSQRAFHKEDESEISNATFRTNSSGKSTIYNDNSNDPIVDNDHYKKIRLGYTSAVNFHRQVLLGFIDNKATAAFDDGYDAYLLDAFPNDMSFISNGIKLVIQGEGTFDNNATFPLALKADQTGTVIFTLDGIENFDNNEKFYILDKLSNTYHDITSDSYEITLDAGEYLDRFSLTFKNSNAEPTLAVNSSDVNNSAVIVAYQQNNRTITIQKNNDEVEIKDASLYDMSGKRIRNWSASSLIQNNFQLPIGQLSSGVYIVTLTTSNGKISQKIIIP